MICLQSGLCSTFHFISFHLFFNFMSFQFLQLICSPTLSPSAIISFTAPQSILTFNYLFYWSTTVDRTVAAIFDKFSYDINYNGCGAALKNANKKALFKRRQWMKVKSTSTSSIADIIPDPDTYVNDTDISSSLGVSVCALWIYCFKKSCTWWYILTHIFK